MARARMNVQEYKQLVADYKNIHDKERRKEKEARLNELKKNILYVIKNDDELYRKRNKAQAEWNELTGSMYADALDCEDDTKNEKLQEKTAKLNKKIERYNEHIKEREEMYKRVPYAG